MFGIGVSELVGIFMVSLLYAIPILLIVFAVRWAISGGIRDAAKKTETATGQQTARQILDERYARGEIGRDEYEQVRRDIETE